MNRRMVGCAIQAARTPSDTGALTAGKEPGPRCMSSRGSRVRDIAMGQKEDSIMKLLSTGHVYHHNVQRGREL